MSEQVTGSPKSSSREKEEENHVRLEGEELSVAIRKQIEYYFSKENLQQDAFLTSHMDANMSVPIAVVMKFSKIRALTHDEEVLVKSLEGSSVSVFDGRIKANVKAGGRSTIILRDIPSDAPEEEVKEIFAYDGAKHVSSLRSDIGDTWFVVMDSEEDAKDTLIDLRLKKRTFRGQPVKGRMKSETMVRSFYPVQTAPVAFGGMPFGFPAPMPMGYGYGMMPNGMALPQPPMLSTENLPNNNNVASAPANDDKESDSPSSGDKKKAAAAASAANVQQKAAGATAAPANNRDAANNSTTPRRPGTAAPVNGVKPAVSGSADSKEKKVGGGNRAGTTGTPSGKKDSKSSSVEITPANFPPLQAGQEETPVPTPGYKTTFVKYTFDDVINIVKTVQEATLPETIKPAEHPLSMTATPNMDLLQRQRTFSIDETREQLRQGRPVQQLAVSGSSGDSSGYGSMMYGDGYASDGQQGVSAAVTKKVTNSTAPAKKPSTGSWAGIVATPAAAQPPLPAPSAAATNQHSKETAKGAAVTSSSSAENSSNWKRGDKVPAVTEKAPAGKSPEKKPTANAGGDKGDKGKKGETKAKKDGKPREDREGAKDDAAEKAEVPSSWGGKPTFANMLKMQQDSDASSPDAGVSSPNPAAQSSSSSGAHASPKKSASHSSEGHNSERKERRGDKGHSESRGGSSGSGKPRGEGRGEGREKKDSHGGHGKGKEGSQ